MSTGLPKSRTCFACAEPLPRGRTLFGVDREACRIRKIRRDRMWRTENDHQ